MTETTIIISKLNAARRQLQTAITLWFQEGDPVSIHVLAYGAYEIIHRVSKERNPSREELLFDADFVKPERRVEFIKELRRHANFFKHAEKDGNAVIEFTPNLSEAFMFFALFGVQTCGEQLNNIEASYLAWLTFHEPDLLREGATKEAIKALPIDQLTEVRRMPKREFMKCYLEGRAAAAPLV